MNIFVLDRDPILAAQYQHDKHVVKMVLETAQMLSTIVYVQYEGTQVEGLYKPTHVNHPCTLWAAAKLPNCMWLYCHGIALAAEYTHRFDKTHASRGVIEGAGRFLHLEPDDPCDPADFALAMPDVYKTADPVASYRAYYAAEKARQSKWTNRQRPEWLP